MKPSYRKRLDVDGVLTRGTICDRHEKLTLFDQVKANYFQPFGKVSNKPNFIKKKRDIGIG